MIIVSGVNCTVGGDGVGNGTVVTTLGSCAVSCGREFMVGVVTNGVAAGSGV